GQANGRRADSRHARHADSEDREPRRRHAWLLDLPTDSANLGRRPACRRRRSLSSAAPARGSGLPSSQVGYIREQSTRQVLRVARSRTSGARRSGRVMVSRLSRHRSTDARDIRSLPPVTFLMALYRRLWRFFAGARWSATWTTNSPSTWP